MSGVQIIGFSMHNEQQLIEKNLKAGAECLLSKADSTSGILRAIYGELPNAHS
jgi:hypothetical protein